ncbi:S41 family peptidase [Brevibacillus fulvus]|uniref:Carboxyl-terminal processing protease n=1 Tax=Brevibacillus fulvus TaxID=1125967 RepID=A0A938XY51_9BACL|nr:S41 family peptidase [Brevibacillus fulvus]MBM7589835.1 carboxyl-terminal processing protease [Brevibacillus fulvus]
MKCLRGIILGVAFTLLFGTTSGYAETQNPYLELDEVFQLLHENHLSRPAESQLVQGALAHVREEVNETKKQELTYAKTDDTLDELEARLSSWQNQYDLEPRFLLTESINGMLSTLDDPHTVFFTEEELRKFTDSVENQMVGFGFRLSTKNDRLLIREIIPNSPAAASELQPGDQILGVDDIDLSGKSLEDALNLLKGPEGSQAVLRIYREKESAEKQIRLKRARLSIPEAEGTLFNDNIGYIKLETFGSDAATQVRDQLQKLTNSQTPMKALIFDLRDNGGGYLTAARDIASLFMEDGLLMYTTDRNGVEMQTWVHNGRQVNYPVIILVNENTASASELLSGSLRDHGIARLVGTKTYGKGSAQQIIPLTDGDALKITLNEYFTPNHMVVNHVGLQPDIEVEDYVGQVIAGLKHFDVKRFVLSESEDGTQINGVEFPILEQIFKEDTAGSTMRNSVLSSITGDQSLPKEGYTSIQSYLAQHKEIGWQKIGNQTIITIP